ncbi:PREDICTED: transmembrane protein 135-like [Dufourea novaeangliae]|uniref:transmembrane protein 135-like n=1 Tax=Dufourea novaeangliae TaxID=178035 RepID=UPI0007672D27|nr:PREDICTED: transmembrane protein 135-like [Dufourea novaeangliae]
MPSQLSKFFLDATCKEYAHPWTDSCINTTAGLGLHALQESLRIYSIVYLVTLLMRGKIPSKEDVRKTLSGILQSTAFLSWSAFSYSMFICFLRRILGRFNLLTVSFVPSFLSSLTAILIERPSRRTMLCLYVSNIATETLFRMGEVRGYYSSIPRGDTYIFALSMALLLYFFRSKAIKQDSMYRILRIIVGKYEEKENSTQSSTLMCSADTSDVESCKKQRSVTKRSDEKDIFQKSLAVYKRLIETLKNLGKHMSCPHPHSCVHYTLTGGVKLFSYGVSAQLALNLVLKMRKLLRTPQLVKSVIFKKGNLNLAVFLGGFAGIYRLASCSLRRLFQKDSSYYAFPAGFIGGLAFMFYGSNTIALYFMWKALQLLWNDLVEKQIVPEVKWFVIVLYCFSTALLFHVAIVEPQNLRPSYWKFLCNISGERIAAMYRPPLDIFGLETSKHLAEVLRKTNTSNKRDYFF